MSRSDEVSILMEEYKLLWEEKLVHKTSIRKFHNYIAYFTAIGSLALVFFGVNKEDIFKLPNNPTEAQQLTANAYNVVQLVCVVLAPTVLATLTFPLNDIFHMYIIGNHVAEIERRINRLTGKSILKWQSYICPRGYEGQRFNGNEKITNVITMGDLLVLGPALFLVCITATVIGYSFIVTKMSSGWGLAYLAFVGYLVAIMLWLLKKIAQYRAPDGALARLVVSSINDTKSPAKKR